MNHTARAGKRQHKSDSSFYCSPIDRPHKIARNQAEAMDSDFDSSCNSAMSAAYENVDPGPTADQIQDLSVQSRSEPTLADVMDKLSIL
jgi:hypothetical protein